MILACTNSGAPGNTNADWSTDKSAIQFPAFSHFPERQFETLALGESNSDMLTIIQNMAVEQWAATEVAHFYFPKDSTELIVSDQASLTEFKVFLYGAHYLNNEAAFRSLLEKDATFVMKDENFQIFQFKTESSHFKMTYFKQDRFIRLHFIHTPDHS